MRSSGGCLIWLLAWPDFSAEKKKKLTKDFGGVLDSRLDVSTRQANFPAVRFVLPHPVAHLSSLYDENKIAYTHLSSLS